MIGRKDCVLETNLHQNFALRLVLVLMTLTMAGLKARADTPSDPIRVCMVRSLCKNVPEPLIKVAMQPFPALMQAQTGYSCELAPASDALELGGQISKKEVQFGVFQGFEFAWAKEKYPELQPLLIAVNQHRNRQAHLIISADAQVNSIIELKNKELAIPRYSRDHCKLFIDRQCRLAGKPMGEFFSKVTTCLNPEEVLDQVVDDKIQAAVIDDVAWGCYKRRKPGRAERLKDFLQSEWFPDTVVVYRAEFMEQAQLHKFQEGLLHAHENPLGRQLLTLWFMSEFQRIPQDYDKLLSDIGKIYPAPVKLTAAQAN